MSEFPEIDLTTILQQRLAQKSSPSSAIPRGPFDPYQMMVDKKKINAAEMMTDQPVQSWPEEDIKKLEEFCKEMGIVGFNCGRMSPSAALAFLKQKLGVMDIPPKTEGYGPNYPYSEAVKKRMLLKG